MLPIGALQRSSLYQWKRETGHHESRAGWRNWRGDGVAEEARVGWRVCDPEQFKRWATTLYERQIARLARVYSS
jgi:hypothetical protein